MCYETQSQNLTQRKRWQIAHHTHFFHSSSLSLVEYTSLVTHAALEVAVDRRVVATSCASICASDPPCARAQWHMGHAPHPSTPTCSLDRGRRDSLLSLRAFSCSSRRCSRHEATTSPTRHRRASRRMASHEYRSVDARPPRPAAPPGRASASERQHVGARGDDVAVQLLEELLARRVPGLG